MNTRHHNVTPTTRMMADHPPPFDVTSPVSGMGSERKRHGEYTPLPDHRADAFTYTVADAIGAAIEPCGGNGHSKYGIHGACDRYGKFGYVVTGSWRFGSTGYTVQFPLESRRATTLEFHSDDFRNVRCVHWWTAWPSRRRPFRWYPAPGGTTRVVINQQQNGGQWNSLGLFSFAEVCGTRSRSPLNRGFQHLRYAGSHQLSGLGNLPPTA